MIAKQSTQSAVRVDDYVIDVLLRDLAGHDRSPAAFLVYLILWKQTRGARKATVKLSHRDIAVLTGLSKSAVQQALRILHRRRLVISKRERETDTPEHEVRRTWVRGE
jgi:transcription initiation factor IIE alpha subunit